MTPEERYARLRFYRLAAERWVRRMTDSGQPEDRIERGRQWRDRLRVAEAAASNDLR